MYVQEPPSPLNRYVIANAIAGGAWLIAWAVIVRVASPLVSIMWVVWAVLGLVSVNCIWFLSGARQVLLGLGFWALVWLSLVLMAFILLLDATGGHT